MYDLTCVTRCWNGSSLTMTTHARLNSQLKDAAGRTPLSWDLVLVKTRKESSGRSPPKGLVKERINSPTINTTA